MRMRSDPSSSLTRVGKVSAIFSFNSSFFWVAFSFFSLATTFNFSAAIFILTEERDSAAEEEATDLDAVEDRETAAVEDRVRDRVTEGAYPVLVLLLLLLLVAVSSLSLLLLLFDSKSGPDKDDIDGAMIGSYLY